MFGWLTERRRRHILENPFPPEWEAILVRNVAAYARLDDGERARLRDLAHIFIAEKRWEGCGGLELSDEIRVTIAGQACLLLLGRDHDFFRPLVTILVYPSAVQLPERKPFIFERVTGPMPPAETILGLSKQGDVVVLAWDEIVGGAKNPDDTRNVVIHELAHVIDFADGAYDGTPPLESRAQRRSWVEVCSAAFLALRERTEHGRKGFLREYAATNEAEFFAVATETFYEQPRKMAEELPELYALLAEFYNLDLAAR
jgi:Mlc titration factor MtfA (ptsG expression regulator)